MHVTTLDEGFAKRSRTSSTARSLAGGGAAVCETGSTVSVAEG